MKMQLRRPAVGLCAGRGLSCWGMGSDTRSRPGQKGAQAQMVAGGVPVFEAAPSSPKPLPDGTFVTEGFVAKDTITNGPPYGSVWNAAFSADPDQQYLSIGDSANSKIWIFRRSDLHVRGSLDSSKNRDLAVDSKVNFYTSAPISSSSSNGGVT